MVAVPPVAQTGRQPAIMTDKAVSTPSASPSPSVTSSSADSRMTQPAFDPSAMPLPIFSALGVSAMR